MKTLGIPPGPRIGQILSILLEEVLDDPGKNTEEYLGDRVGELGKMSDAELKKLTTKARERKDEFEIGLEEDMKKKFYVK